MDGWIVVSTGLVLRLVCDDGEVSLFLLWNGCEATAECLLIFATLL